MQGIWRTGWVPGDIVLEAAGVVTRVGPRGGLLGSPGVLSSSLLVHLPLQLRLPFCVATPAGSSLVGSWTCLSDFVVMYIGDSFAAGITDCGGGGGGRETHHKISFIVSR